MNYITLFSLFLYPIFSFATIAPDEVKNTYEVFGKDFSHLSPLPGMIWYQGGVLENLAEWGQERENPNITLINRLFFRTDPFTFKESREERNVATYFEPKLLGQMAAVLNNFNILLSEDKSLMSLLRATKPQNLVKNPKVSNVTKLLTDLIEKATEKKAGSYPGLLVRALLTSNENISVFKTLGALAYLKSNDKNDLHQYFLGIDQQSLLNVYTNKDFLGSKKAEWINAVFEEKDIAKAFKPGLSYERMAFSLLNFESWIAPYLTGYQTAYLLEGEGFGFPDCGENSLLNFYRTLLAKKDDLKIDIDLLKQVNTPPELLDFFIAFPNLKILRTVQARNAWAALTSNLPKLCEIPGAYLNRNEYCQRLRKSSEHCEMSAGFINMDRFIGELQGMSFDALMKNVNEFRRNKFSIKKELDNQGFGTITINTDDRGDLQWNFNKNHFVFRSVSPKSEATWLNDLISASQPEKDLISLLPITKEKLTTIFKQPDSDYLIYLNKFNDDEDIVKFLIAAIKNQSVNNSLILIKRLQSDDAHLMIRKSVLENSRLKVVERYLNLLAEMKKLLVLETKIPILEETSLEEAFSGGNKEVISLLLDILGQDAIDAQGKNKFTALHWAALYGYVDVVRFLLQKMSQNAIDAQDDLGKTALFEAAGYGYDEIVQLLLNKMSKPAINMKDKMGNTVLHWAVKLGHSKNIFRLLLLKMSPEGIKAKDSAGQTALDLATRYGQKEIIEILAPHYI